MTESNPTIEPEDEVRDQEQPALPPLPPEMYFESLMKEVERHWRQRTGSPSVVFRVESRAERLPELRRSLEEMIGEFPDRTPLNAQVVGRVERPDYAVERVVFESRPRFYVTANLYVPPAQTLPRPGILVPCGHAPTGKAHEPYQRIAAHLAKKGFVVLIYDPIGQGERVQYWNVAERQPLLGAGTTEHFADGNLCYLLGMNLAQIRTWDGVRALDYLATRPEVDDTRLGCAGSSGGGIVTVYLSALDNRIKAAAACCSVTTLYDRCLSRRIHDPEQNLLPLIATDMEMADLLALSAPRPFLIGAAQRDYVPFGGARKVYAEVRKFYHWLGSEERVSMVEVDSEHGWSLGLRQAVCAWMNRWLGEEGQPPTEPAFEPLAEPDTWCFPGGNVYLHVRAATVSDLLVRWFREIRRERLERLTPYLTTHDREVLAERIARVVRCEAPAGPPEVNRGPIEDAPWGTVQELHITSEPGVVVPATLHQPHNAAALNPAVVLVHSAGRSKVSGPDSPAAQLAEAGFFVLCVDPRGIGDTASKLEPPGSGHFRDRDAEQAYVALMAGIVPLGRRVFDLWCSVVALRRWPGVDPDAVGCVGWERAGLWVGHLGALCRSVQFIGQVGALSSYASLLPEATYRGHVADMPPRALHEYDLPQLVAVATPRAYLVSRPVGPTGSPLSEAEVEETYAQAVQTYASLHSDDRLELVPGESDPTAVVDWVQRAVSHVM